MTFRKSIAISLLAAAVAAPAMAQGPKIYPVPAQGNYCPGGLQPITIAGVICCGKPNQGQTYQQVMRHPVAKARSYGKVSRARAVETCPEGVKGCY